jgi:hypothetical protein
MSKSAVVLEAGQVELNARLSEALLPCHLMATVQIARWVDQQTEKANGQVWVDERNDTPESQLGLALWQLSVQVDEIITAILDSDPANEPVALVEVTVTEGPRQRMRPKSPCRRFGAPLAGWIRTIQAQLAGRRTKQ